MSTATIDLSQHPRAKGGGLSLGLVRFEMMRVLRNRRTMIFTLIFPVAMFLLIAMQIKGKDDVMGPGVIANVGAYIMVSMGLYGAIMATTSAGASVSIERASGWSRQLRLTPLRPAAYIVAKMLAALLMGAIAIGITAVVGAATGKAHMSAGAWVEMLVIVVFGSLVFAALGLFLGYLLPSENVMQFLGPILAFMSIFGGLFGAPIDPDSGFGHIARVTPIYGLSQIAHWPLTETTSGGHDPFQMEWIVNLVVWGAIFVLGAIWRFRKDTARV